MTYTENRLFRTACGTILLVGGFAISGCSGKDADATGGAGQEEVASAEAYERQTSMENIAEQDEEAALFEEEEQAARVAAAKEAAQLATEEEAARVAAEKEADRIAAEEEAARVAAEKEAARIAAEEEVARIAAQEAARIAAEEEVARVAAEKEAARIAAEQEVARVAAEKEAARVAAEEEAARIAAEKEAARVAAEEEAARIVAEQEAARIAAEKEASRIAAEKAARALAEQAIRDRFRLADDADMEKMLGGSGHDRLAFSVHLDQISNGFDPSGGTSLGKHAVYRCSLPAGQLVIWKNPGGSQKVFIWNKSGTHAPKVQTRRDGKVNQNPVFGGNHGDGQKGRISFLIGDGEDLVLWDQGNKGWDGWVIITPYGSN